ncbi:hydroxyacid oxidase 1 isoform X3 [Cygnus olor]|uniref:hydroxyacid oxidase 1 isoform X3 n=1 Tax=Cygnus olor TaxID=8869 RepID=UPI001ADE2CAE|nr:hydroxyacid oxidase 1 isoform X3 [Cygnus olor]
MKPWVGVVSGGCIGSKARWKLYPRVLRDVSVMDLSTSVLGQKISMPVCVGATAMQRMAHADGEMATARACQATGTGMMLSSWATSSIEEVAEAAPDSLRWLQLYVYKDREVTKSLVKRAERAGYKGIFVTVDTPFLGRRIDDVRNKFQLPPHLRLKNFTSNSLAFSSGKDFGENSGLAVYVAEAIDSSVKWEDVKWLRGLTSLPIVTKGILRADDAKEAVKLGVNGILVSNHGARQLDGVPATVSTGANMQQVLSAFGFLFSSSEYMVAVAFNCVQLCLLVSIGSSSLPGTHLKLDLCPASCCTAPSWRF